MPLDVTVLGNVRFYDRLCGHTHEAEPYDESGHCTLLERRGAGHGARRARGTYCTYSVCTVHRTSKYMYQCKL
eukprot:SAG31_NODE_330_length_17593_cov_4.817891_27_plen_73_part_00